MNKNNCIRFLGFLLLAFLSLAHSTRADSREGISKSDMSDHSPKLQIAQSKLDPRLPPVLPGQEVEINGKKMKVWSTSGSISDAGHVPVPNNTLKNGQIDAGNGQGISVIVDGRNYLPGTPIAGNSASNSATVNSAVKNNNPNKSLAGN